MDRDLAQIIVTQQTSIREAIETLNITARGIVYVCEERKLLGTVTDGDIRRGLLRGLHLEAPIYECMNSSFHSSSITDSTASIYNNLRSNKLRELPLLDADGHVVDSVNLDGMKKISSDGFTNPVVIMAGGEGKRLRPLTENTPKPMLKIKGEPLLEILLKNLIASGYSNFYFSVGYLKEHIKNYFLDGHAWGVDIKYLEESTPRGTAGALSLLKRDSGLPILVLNADLLTKLDFSTILGFHVESEAQVTIGVFEYQHRIPFGVINQVDGKITSFEEKPLRCEFVNAGIYVVNPCVLDLIKPDEFLDMPSLIERCMELSHQIQGFPIHEYWLDIGLPHTFEQARYDW